MGLAFFPFKSRQYHRSPCSPSYYYGYFHLCFLAIDSPLIGLLLLLLLLVTFAFAGSHERLVAATNVCNEKFGTSARCFYQSAPMLMAMGVDQAGRSEATSEASTTESVVANLRKNAIMHAKGDNDGEQINFTFIDFLGVGAT